MTVTIQYRYIGGKGGCSWEDWGTCRDQQEAIAFIRSAQVSDIINGGIPRDWRCVPVTPKAEA